jgi:hypothetical protein
VSIVFSPACHYPTFAGYSSFVARIVPLIAWGNGNSRSLGAKRARSGTDLSYCRLLHDHPAAHAGAGSARSRAISDKISENSQRGTATSASRTVT